MSADSDPTPPQQTSSRTDASKQSAFNTLFNTVKDGIILHDGTIVKQANLSIASACGHTNGDALNGTTVSDLVCKRDRETFSAFLRHGLTTSLQVDILRSDDSTYRARLFNTPFKLDDAACQLLTIVDISELETSERHLVDAYNRLHKAEQLETAGSSAGQLAHDFNNLLSPLLAYPPLVRMSLEDGDPAHEYIDEMERSSKSMAHMTLQLLTLARRGGGTDEIFDMNRVAASVADTLAMSTASNIQVETQLEDPIHPVMGQADLIFRVMDSLCQNAVDALGEAGGTITLSTANVRVNSDSQENADIEYIRASVTDTGPGIPPEVKERIFEPFFTTHRNDDERRTGLGLNIAQNIIKDHSGYMTVDASNEGTSVNIFIPIFPVDEDSDTPVGQGESILIVDDDPLQISIMGRHLSSIGYQVISATSSTKALEYLMNGPSI